MLTQHAQCNFIADEKNNQIKDHYLSETDVENINIYTNVLKAK